MTMTTLTYPTQKVAAFVANLARRHGVSYIQTSNDAFASLVTTLSDDTVVTDSTQDLIVALKRAKVIDGKTMVALLGNHLDEQKNVQPVW